MPRRWTTTLAAFRKLYELLDASTRPGLNGDDVAVVWGNPGDNQPDRLVSVGRVETADQDAAALGQRRREERYRLEVVVDVAFRADSHDDVNEAFEAVVQAIEAEVHDHPTLDGALHADGIAEVGGIDIDAVGQLETGAFQTVGIIHVDCRARI